jgi:hypothetical protein
MNVASHAGGEEVVGHGAGQEVDDRGLRRAGNSGSGSGSRNGIGFGYGGHVGRGFGKFRVNGAGFSSIRSNFGDATSEIKVGEGDDSKRLQINPGLGVPDNEARTILRRVKVPEMSELIPSERLRS